MTSIDQEIIVHKLNIDPTYHPAKQKKWKFALKHQKAFTKEVDKLVKATLFKK